MDTTIQTFPVTYGEFTKELTINAGGPSLKVRLAHRKVVEVKLHGHKIGIGMIRGYTPKTYYSGNREYGKFVFILAENIRAVKKVYTGKSNEDAERRNTSTLRGGAYGAKSFGFDFYRIKTIRGEGDVSIETAQELKGEIEFSNFDDLSMTTFVKVAMPYNLAELIPGFPYQTQGWRDNDPCHLHAVTEINGVRCFIPFAAETPEIGPIDGVKTVYIKEK